MKIIFKLLLLMSLVLSIISCGLDRDNPLDPENGNIVAPPLVTNLEASASGYNAITKWVRLSWIELTNNEADGYFIYRSRSYDGTYQLITTGNTILDVNENSFTDTNVTAGAYFYKISAYKYLDPLNPNDNERLEGPLNPEEYGVPINVPF